MCCRAVIDRNACVVGHDQGGAANNAVRYILAIGHCNGDIAVDGKIIRKNPLNARGYVLKLDLKGTFSLEGNILVQIIIFSS